MPAAGLARSRSSLHHHAEATTLEHGTRQEGHVLAARRVCPARLPEPISCARVNRLSEGNLVARRIRDGGGRRPRRAIIARNEPLLAAMNALAALKKGMVDAPIGNMTSHRGESS
jgi:hypothetical protein